MPDSVSLRNKLFGSCLSMDILDTVLCIFLELPTSVSVFGVQIRACGGGVETF